MVILWKISMFLLLIVHLASSGITAAEEAVLFREEFDTLEAWEPLYFSKIDAHTQYSTTRQDGGMALKAVSEASASALVYKEKFNITDYPILRWRWKVDRVYAQGNYRLKSGDDYPLRVYVLFAYDPERAGLATRLKYGLAHTLYGRYPPSAALNYIWANRTEESEPVVSPYTDQAVLIPLRQGPGQVGQWVTEQVNLLEDYRRAFGQAPPAEASLAVMSDGDNTGEGATAYIDFIEVGR
ncbi:MAG: DUF3047 domain-containing protein [Desulfobacterales bacterium]